MQYVSGGMANRYLDPLSDFGFKRLFGTEPNKDLLIAFLNALLPARHQIHELRFGSVEFVGQQDTDRRVLFDLYCVAQDGERFIVEVQRAMQVFFKDRCLFYSTFPIQEQAQRGHWSFRLAPVYVVAILDFAMDEEPGSRPAADANEYLHLVELKDQHGRVFYDKYKQIYVELPRFRKTERELAKEVDHWLYALRHLAELESPPSGFSSMTVFEKFFQEAEIAGLSPEERARYQASLKESRDFRNMLETAIEKGERLGLEKGERLGLEKGERLGLKKGERLGLKKGERLGLEKGERLGEQKGIGRGRHEEAVDTVRAALAAGLTPQQVAAFSSLSLDEIVAIARG